MYAESKSGAQGGLYAEGQTKDGRRYRHNLFFK
jgi:hypothetical protein